MNNKTIISMKCILIVCWMMALVLPVQAASFDCGKATSKVEKLICEDDELSKLDDALNKTYGQVLDRSEDKQAAVKEQRQWLKKVRNTCQDKVCLKTACQERINKLGMMVGQTLIEGSSNTIQTQAALPPNQKTSLCTPASLCDKVTLMYSEDDSICKPLLQVYQQLWVRQKEKRSWQDHYWEDYHSKVFVKAGFVPPPPVRDKQHKYIPTESSMSGELANVYYKLKLDPNVAEQTVLIRDNPFASHGAYSSSVYISKPEEDISTDCPRDYSSHNADSPDAYGAICSTRNSFNQLAFAADFRWDGDDDIHAETLISQTYYFEKENTDEKFSHVLFGKPIPLDIHIGKSTIQRFYLFRNQPIFTANDDGNVVVYRIKNGSEMDDVCYFAANVLKISH